MAIEVVAIDAVDDDWLAIYQELATLNDNASKANLHL